MMNKINIKPTAGNVGVEIDGVDLSKKVPGSLFNEIRSAFIENGLIFFRDQNLAPEEHIRFAEQWGKININRFFTKVDGYDQVAEVRKESDQKENIGGEWHTDHSYDQIPALGSILLAKEIPSSGGDTLFACMYKAYETI